MRETVTIAKCDNCKKPAIGTYVVGVAFSEEAPALHVMDACEEHAERIHRLAEFLDGLPLLNGSPKRAPARQRRAKARLRCRICSAEFDNRHGVVQHVWQIHTAAGRPPRMPSQCPDCNKQFPDGRQQALHSRKVHGYDALEAAYSAAFLNRREG